MLHTASPLSDQNYYLSILSRAPAGEVKAFVDDLIPLLGLIDVLYNRTGLVMVPMTDSAQGTMFYLGEVLVAEAYVRIDTSEGYGACLGRDLEQALAMALVDAAIVAGIACQPIEAFIRAQAAMLNDVERTLMEQVEATRVTMETF